MRAARDASAVRHMGRNDLCFQVVVVEVGGDEFHWPPNWQTPAGRARAHIYRVACVLLVKIFILTPGRSLPFTPGHTLTKIFLQRHENRQRAPRGVRPLRLGELVCQVSPRRS